MTWKRDNLIGKIFNDLTVIKEAGRCKHNRVLYSCICKCGGSIITNGTRLKQGYVKGCKLCSRKRKVETGRKRNGIKAVLIGRIFRRLTVIKEVGKDRHGNFLWFCTCKCGGTKTTTSTKLLRKQVQSCGCLQKEHRNNFGKRLKLPEGEASLNIFYTRYTNRAKRKNSNFTLTKKEFKELTKQNCFYCNCPPTAEHILNGPNYPHDSSSPYIGNGLDRINNSKGYDDPDNLVPCCQICNFAKRALSPQEFITWLKRISKNVDEIERKFQEKGLLNSQT